MFGGIGNVLLSTYSQTENGEDPLVSLVNHVITTRGRILVSRTNDDAPAPPPVCRLKKKPCVDSKRLRVYRHHAHMCYHMCAWCRHTRRRFECTHGGVSNPHTFFHVFFSVPPHTQTHTNTHHDQQQHHDHNDTHHTETETERETETDRNRER